MKTNTKLILAALTIFISCCAFKWMEDAFTKTGLDQGAIKRSIVTAALNGSKDDYRLAYAGANIPLTFKTMKAIALNDRGAIVNELGAYMKAYYNSPEFKKDFDAALQMYVPKEFHDSAFYQSNYEKELKATNDAYDQYKKQYSKANIQSSADQSFGNAQGAMDMAKQYLLAHPELAAAQGVDVNEALKKLQEAQGQTKEKQKETNTEIADKFTDEKVAADRAEMEKKYKETLIRLKKELDANLLNVPVERARFNKETTEYKLRSNSKANLGSAFQKYLAKTDGIDFNAEIKPVNPTNANSLKRFTNPDYEKKDALWKSGYRAGKEATTAAREFVQKWAGELK